MKKTILFLALGFLLTGQTLFAQNSFNWQQISTANDSYTRIVKTNDGQFLCGAQTNSILYRSTDLSSFVPQQSNLVSHNLAFGKDNNGSLYFGTGHTGLYKSIDNGNNWIYNVAGGFGCGALDFTCDANNKLFVSIGGYLRGLYVSSDAGTNWSNSYSGIDFQDIEVNNANNLVLITSGGHIWSSPIQNISWNEITGQSFNNNVVMAKSLGNDIFVFTNNGSIYKSTNGGINWNLYSQIPIVGTPSAYLNDAILKNDGIWYVGLESQGVWRSVDYGITWQNINQGITGDFRYLFYDMPNVVVTTSTGIFKLLEAEIGCNTLVINTGVLSLNPPIYNSSITIYPNPANDQVTIDCGNLANVTGWSIKITNSIGQEVFNGLMNTQQYVVPLNSWSGQGIYFVHIYDASNNLVNTKKIILQ